MNSIAMQLQQERDRLLSIRNTILIRAQNLPEGTLRVSYCRDKAQYYRYFPTPSGSTNRTGKYIPYAQTELIRGLAQKEYDQKVLTYIDRALPNIERLLKVYDQGTLENLYRQESLARKSMITPVLPDWEEQLKQWIDTPYTGKGFRIGETTYTTNRGEQVRSKSEKIMADYFDHMGIPYKYECPLKFSTSVTFYPDFTFLLAQTRREKYWEHHGMMDNVEYASATANKIEFYEKHHIYPGEQLILTFETKDHPLDIDLLKQLTKRYLL